MHFIIILSKIRMGHKYIHIKISRKFEISWFRKSLKIVELRITLINVRLWWHQNYDNICIWYPNPLSNVSVCSREAVTTKLHLDGWEFLFSNFGLSFSMGARLRSWGESKYFLLPFHTGTKTQEKVLFFLKHKKLKIIFFAVL